MNQTQQRFLSDLLEQPTAPFREQQVRSFAEIALTRWDIPHCRDPHGNLLVGVDSAADYRRLLRTRSDIPVRLYIAHMDHPGFHGDRWLSPRRLEITWHGGSPAKHLAGAKVWLSAGAGYVAEGVLRKVRLHPKGYALQHAEVVFAHDSVTSRHTQGVSTIRWFRISRAGLAEWAAGVYQGG